MIDIPGSEQREMNSWNVIAFSILAWFLNDSHKAISAKSL
jgi:hypothetical protein